MAKGLSVPAGQRALIVLSGTFVATVLVLSLYVGRPILIPIAMAILLTVLLNPVVRFLERRRLGRIPSVAIATSIAAVILLSLGWIVTRQVSVMMAELPRYTENIKEKVKNLRELTASPFFDRFGKMFAEISEASETPAGELDRETTESLGDDEQSEKRAETLILKNEPAPWLRLTEYLGSAVDLLATAAFTLVLLIVFLLKRDDLRDRIVVLAGTARIALTSKALEDVTDRISRYIVMVAVVNGSYGLMLTVGLLVCGVPYALLWGFLAGIMRFVPYIGPWVGAIFPMVLSLAVSVGWWQPIAVFGFIVILELVSNNIIEPLVFGRSTGVSPVALLISAAFWAFLWGPVGLVLSAPFAVCLVVLGKNIPQLKFLNLLLGDEPAVRENMEIYLRLMQGDEHEAIRLVLQRMKESPADEIFDEMLVPALNYTKRDFLREHLTDDDRGLLLKRIREALRETDDFLQKAAVSQNGTESQPGDSSRMTTAALSPIRILVSPGMDDINSVALEMFRQLLHSTRWVFEETAVETLTSELVAQVAANPPAVLCIASLPPGGLAHARYLCKRLRAVSPEMPIIVGRWGRSRNSRIDSERLIEVGASFVTASLSETCQLLNSRFPT
jgi:predicted PurR-regulated permease PerM